MNTFLTLREAGLPYPNMDTLHHITKRLSGPAELPFVVYGGYLRDLVLLGHTRATGDVDAAMHIDDFLALKPQKDGDVDVRRHFALHEPHLLFMLHQMQDNQFQENSRPIVLALKHEYQADWNMEIPLGLALTRKPIVPFALAQDTDLGFCEIVSDGREIWVSEAFIHDYTHRTLTLRRCRDARDYERTVRRVQRFTTERYLGWRFVVPEHLQHMCPA